jgi:hypothetical protein
MSSIIDFFSLVVVVVTAAQKQFPGYKRYLKNNKFSTIHKLQ